MNGFLFALLFILALFLLGLWKLTLNSSGVVDYTPCPPPFRLNSCKPDASDGRDEVMFRVRMLTEHVIQLEEDVARLRAKDA